MGTLPERDSMTRAWQVLAVLAAGVVVAWWLPVPAEFIGIAGYAPLHTTLETVAVVVAALVFAVGWNGTSGERPGNVVVLSCGFLAVALLDFSHALSYAGMPAFLTPSGPEKAINFWLAARLVAAVTLLLAIAIAWRPCVRPATRWLALAGVLATVAAVYAWFLVWPDAVPRTFVPGSGLTPFKLACEYALIGLNLAALVLLLGRGEAASPFHVPSMLVAVGAMALSEFFFTLYASVTDLYNLLGHIYKVLAYGFLYRAVFVETIVAPIVATHAAKQRLRATLETIPDLLWLKDTQGVYLDCNPPFERFFGAPRDHIVGRSDADFVAPELAAMFRRHDLRAMEAGRPVVEEAWATFADGGYRGLFQTVKTPMHDADGRLVGVLGIARDITDRHQAEAERHQLETQLRESQKMESLGNLAGGIAHDFNNVLGAILGHVALARADLPAGHAAHHSLEQVSRAADRARDLVQQILAFSRRQPQSLRVQPLQPLVSEVLRFLRTTFPAMVKVQIELSGEPLHVALDAAQMQQVLINLCTNAWHALPTGKGCITVAVDAAPAEPGGPPTAHLWVRDDGVGMAPEVIGRIFEPFFTTKPAGQGTGLGLAVAHGIVTAHHGTIRVESAPGAGSTFHIHLPLQPAPAVPEPPQPRERAEPPAGGEHVLYVDDDEVMTAMVEQLLGKLGYRVTTAANADEAQARVARDPAAVDAVVTDYNMPARTGLDLARSLIALRPDLPVVISSGFVSQELLSGASAAGLAKVLNKERTLEDLPPMLAELFARRLEPA